VFIEVAISITGLGALSALGSGIEDHYRAVMGRVCPFRRLGGLLGDDSVHAEMPGAWIEDRAGLTHRKWSPATMAVLRVARQALAQAGWSSGELRDAALVLGTSRGNAAGWLGPWPGRRPFALMAASNTIHSEPATAVGIEFGMTGPNHVVASGCAAGLDALGIAWMLLRAGLARRALVVAVDLPLVPLLLDNYAASGLLSDRFAVNPYGPQSNGFIPAEGAAAMAIECGEFPVPRLNGYACNADAVDPVGIPADGGGTVSLVRKHLMELGPVAAVCPHGTGTAVQAAADPAWLARVFSGDRPTLHLLKPYLGHTIGASGLLESVILARFLAEGNLPPNPDGMHAPEGFSLPTAVTAAKGAILKLSHGMGGHNAIITISPP
jgi:3-oxoacyl-[acyl-carrier-protein] synthase II